MNENTVYSKLHVGVWFHIRVDIPITKPMMKVACHHLSKYKATPDMELLRVEGFDTMSSGENVLRVN